jgi:hypothetical protein
MAPPSPGSGSLTRAREVLGDDDVEFVLAGLEGLPPARAFVVLDGLRSLFDWDSDVHLDLVEHVFADERHRASLN